MFGANFFHKNTAARLEKTILKILSNLPKYYIKIAQ
jgi:hypothetical protein